MTEQRISIQEDIAARISHQEYARDRGRGQRRVVAPQPEEWAADPERIVVEGNGKTAPRKLRQNKRF